MTNPFADQKKFMKACGQSTEFFNEAQVRLYADLMWEEFGEWWESRSGTTDDIDACIDLIVVTIGYMISRGWDVEGAWQEVMRSNMAKIDPTTGTVHRREDGKILKPKGWTPPDLSRFVK